MLSVIIPAHNEETVIARCLRAIVTGAAEGELEVVVACNGCTDRTAQIARAFGPPVRVVEIPVASKTAALNAAEECVTSFPRFYVDADVVLDFASIRAMARVLERGDVHFATPSLRLDLSRSSWPVRAFYCVWTQLPYNREHGQVGTGVYALSQVGRTRFLHFPDVINDDGFVRFRFAPAERSTVSEATSLVTPPRRFVSLIRAKTRVCRGRRQLRHLEMMSSGDRPRALPVVLWLLPRPTLWSAFLVYLCTVMLVRLHSTSSPSVHASWNRDDSRSMSRAPGARPNATVDTHSTCSP